MEETNPVSRSYFEGLWTHLIPSSFNWLLMNPVGGARREFSVAGSQVHLRTTVQGETGGEECRSVLKDSESNFSWDNPAVSQASVIITLR